MNEDENVKKNQKYLDDLAKQEKYIGIRICPECKSSQLEVMGIPALYSPLSPVRCRCKNCGWMGSIVIEMSNRKISEKDEEILEDIISIFSEEE